MRSTTWLSWRKSHLLRGFERKVLKRLIPTLDWWTEVAVWTGSRATVGNGASQCVKWLFKQNKAGFLATDCHFLYLQLLSLPRSQYIHNSIHKGSLNWKTENFVLYQPKVVLPYYPQLCPSVQMHSSWKNMQKKNFHAPLGMATIQFFSNRCHRSAFFLEPRKMGGGGVGAKNKGMMGDVLWQTACFKSDRLFRMQTHHAQMLLMCIDFIFRMHSPDFFG